MMMERLKFSFQWNFLVFLAFLTACKTNAGENLSDVIIDDSDIKDLISGDIHYKRLVWDPTRSTVVVFNVSGTSPLHIILIRKKVGHCEMFFLRLRGVLESQGSNLMIVCVAELSAESLEEKCKWINDSGTVNINQGDIYGMPKECGPWYLTIYVPAESSNTTELAVEVSEPYDPLVFRWFRVITNLAIWPGIVVAFMRRYYAEAIIYFLTFVFSSAYHLCEAELSCFKGYSRMHFSDYFVSDLSIVCTIWSMTRIQPPNKHIVFLTIAILLQFAVYETLSSTYHFVIDAIFAAPALIYVFFQQIYRTVKYKRLYPSPRRWLLNLLPGYSLALTGAIVNLVISGDENYYYVHCIWHLTIMLSVAFLLPVPADKDPDERWWTEKLERDTYTPL